MAVIKVAPMSSAVAWPIITRAEGIKKLNGTNAKAVLLLYFKLKGFSQDHYGNWFSKPPHRTERFHFKSRNIQRQYKDTYGWHNRWSVSIIDYAEAVILAAGRDVEQPETVAHIAKKATSRSKAKKSAAVRREHETLRSESSRIAFDRVMSRDPFWEIAYQVLVLGKNGPLTKRWNEQAIPVVKVEQDKLLEQLEHGKAPAEARWSVDRPPLMIFRRDDRVYSWNEKVAGVPYTVMISSRGRNSDDAEVHLGRTGELGMRVDPLSHAISADLSSFKHAQGDAYVSGMVRKRGEGKPPQAVLFLISAQSKRSGAGTRVLSLWCDLMAGYGVEQWVAQAVGAEGVAFFEALEKKGKITIEAKRGRNWTIQCRSFTPNRALNVVEGRN